MKTSFSKTVRQAALNTIFGFRAVSVALVMAAIIPNAVYAQTWVGPGTDYNDPANWSPNTVPNNNFGQTAEFAGTTAPSTVNLSSYTIVAVSFTMPGRSLIPSQHRTATSSFLAPAPASSTIQAMSRTWWPQVLAR
jgi:hypothetical protein